jgi:hypothetical protein
VTQSISSIAFIPGPLLGGLLYQVGGSSAPFITSGLILSVAFGLGYIVFRPLKR